MPRNWKALAEASEGVYEENDFKQALYQLVVNQCLYSRFIHQRTSYRLIANYRRDFEEAADLMGLRMCVIDHYEFCYVVPVAVKHTQLETQETLFLLVLRQLYHLRGNAGELTVEGDAIVGPEELVSTYHSMTGGELDTKSQGVIKGLVKFSSKSGIARLVDAPDGDPQPFAIAILPGIAEILSEHVVGRFGAHVKSGLVGKTNIEGQAEKDIPDENT